jgi:hypothetical protein
LQDPLKAIPLSGFDSDGEPVIRLMSDGSLYLVFNFMPPTWAEADPEAFGAFDKKLQKAIGLPVIWEDREFFPVKQPAEDTVDQITIILHDLKRELKPLN